MTLQEKKDKLKAEIKVAQSMLHENALKFKPSKYIFNIGNGYLEIAQRLVAVPMKAMQRALSGSSHSSYDANRESWWAVILGLLSNVIKR